MSQLTVLGIDPASIRNMGAAILKVDTEARSFEVAWHSTVVLPNFETDGARLSHIYDEFQKILDEYNPTVMAIELSRGFGKSFVRQNLQESVGVIKMCCHRNDVEVIEPAPNHIKLVIAGSGKAKKKDMKFWVKQIAPDMEKPKTEHEADAVGSALTYLIDEDFIDRVHEVKKKK
jgi:Holliday junction resolvasome RuvABC endonuclease subunit